jgi:hypothetical protein
MDKLQTVTEFLLVHENMSSEQFAACMENRPVNPDDAGSLFDSFQNPVQGETE